MEKAVMKFVVCCGMLAVMVATLAGCSKPQPVTTRNSELTHGNVQMNLKVGESTQTDVLEVFGAPNITSIDSTGQEVWTYQRHATVTQSSSRSGYWTIVLAGGGRSSSGYEQTSRTMTLMIKFDENKVVSDFKSRASNF